MDQKSDYKPTKSEILAASGKTVPDVITPNLKVLFCGINPGLYTAAIGHHFGRPGNRFWPVLYKSGFTERLLSPFDERELLKLGYGITNIFDHATAAADEISQEALKEGAEQLKLKILKFRPKILAVLGIGAYKIAFNKQKAKLGKQDERIGETIIWILPNPSGLNAHYDLEGLAKLFMELKIEADRLEM